MEVWLMVSLSIVLVVLINEVVKLHEIRYGPIQSREKPSFFCLNGLTEQYLCLAEISLDVSTALRVQ